MKEKTLQALHDAQSELSARDEKEATDMAFSYLYAAEEALAEALGFQRIGRQ